MHKITNLSTGKKNGNLNKKLKAKDLKNKMNSIEFHKKVKNFQAGPTSEISKKKLHIKNNNYNILNYINLEYILNI